MSYPGKSVAWPLSLALVVLAAAALVRAQDAPKPPVAWEYRLLSWEAADLVTVFRTITGDKLGDLSAMVRAVAEEGLELRANPRLQHAIDVQLAAKLDQAGGEGWEAFWVRDTTRIVNGHVIPAPSVLLRRRR